LGKKAQSFVWGRTLEKGKRFHADADPEEASIKRGNRLKVQGQNKRRLGNRSRLAEKRRERVRAEKHPRKNRGDKPPSLSTAPRFSNRGKLEKGKFKRSKSLTGNI